MDGYGIRDLSMLQDLAQFGSNPTGDALFDASQYEFFGGNSVEEVELGGLEDEEEGHASIGFEEGIQSDKEEGNALGSLSEIDDLSSTFLKLNKVASGPTSAGFSRDRGSRESSSASEFGQDPSFNNWFDQRAYDTSSSHPYSSSSAHFMEPNSLHRTSSYPEQQPQILRHQHSSEPILSPNSPFTSYPPHGGRSHQGSLNDLSNILYHHQIPRLDLSSFPNSHLSQFGRNLPQIQNQRVNQNTTLYPGLGLMHPQMMPPQHTRMRHPFQPQPSISHLHSQLLHHQHLSPSSPNLNMLGFQDLRDQRLRARHPMTRYPNQTGPRFRSKYMSPDELENIHRMQLAATHSNDPYVEDYHHQAILARKSSNARLRHHFSPSNLRDGSPKPNEPHAFLRVDALGRVSFSSIRRPRPLLEVDPPKSSDNSESKFPEKSLEQEPMLAARVAIEDGICLLLDVDDIDRYLEFNQLPDGGAQLRQRRQVLLEGLASSLQLIDPLGKNGETASLLPRDDFVFLRLVSLPKGKKLLSRYLELLSRGELVRVVCMAICRNLRFLFGIMSENQELLARAVSSCVVRMDLKSLSACLVSVVCGAENPPLRPMGHVSGDGASVIVKSVLERGTEVLTGSEEGDNCSEENRGFWQTSFDAFFGLLTKCCFSKYDYVLQSFVSRGLLDVGPEVGKAISREMPVELLRASLPHTSEKQRKLLLEFAQRSMV